METGLDDGHFMARYAKAMRFRLTNLDERCPALRVALSFVLYLDPCN